MAKNKATRHYAMNLNDGRIVLVTRELLTNPDYRVVSKEVAIEIEKGKRDWRKVAYSLRKKDALDPQALVMRAEQEKVKNIHKSPVTRENVEQFETQVAPDEIGEIYNGDDDDDEPDGGEEQGDKPPKKPTNKRVSRRPPKNDEPDGGEEQGEESDGGVNI